MVPHQVGRPVEPEEREAGEDAALVGDRRRQHRVERADAIGRHDQQPVADLVDVAHLAARVQDGVRAHASSTGSFSSRSNTPSRFARYRLDPEERIELRLGTATPASRDLLPHSVLEAEAAVPGVLRGALDRGVRVIARHTVIDERRQHALTEEDAAGGLHVGAHPIGVDVEAVHHPRHVAQHEMEEPRRVRQDHALGRRVRDVALVPQRHVLERHLRVSADHPRQPGHALGHDRVPLVRHGARALLALRRTAPAPRGPRIRARCLISVAIRSRVDAVMASAETNSAWRSRWITWVLASSGRKPEPGADELLHPRVDGGVRAHDAADRAHAHDLPRAPQAFAVAIQLERHDRELVSEAGRLRVDAVGAPDHHGVAVLQREPLHDAEQHLQPSEQQVGRRAQLQRQSRVQHIRGRHPEVDPSALGSDRVRDHLHERGDVVTGDGLDLEHPVHRERGAFADRACVLGRDRADLRPGFDRRYLDLQPVRETGLV